MPSLMVVATVMALVIADRADGSMVMIKDESCPSRLHSLG
jgi:hypothetical protein